MPTRSPLTLLLDAVLLGDADRVEVALSRIRPLVNLESLCGNPLQSISALEEIVQALMMHHPQLAKVSTSRDNSLPLHYAVRMNSIKIVSRLLQRYREGIFMQNAQGKTPLHFAARVGKLDMVRQILQIAPETAAIRSENGKLPLHFACREGHLEIAKELLQVHPQGASWQTDKCKVALHFAARWGHIEIAKELLRVYPQGVSILDYEGSLPLHDATRQGQTRMAKYLAPLYLKGLELENVRGETPLFTAVRSGNYELSSFLLRAWPEGGKHVLQSACFDDRVGTWEPGLLNMCLFGASMEKGGGANTTVDIKCHGIANSTTTSSTSSSTSSISSGSGSSRTFTSSRVLAPMPHDKVTNKRSAPISSNHGIAAKRRYLEKNENNYRGSDDHQQLSSTSSTNNEQQQQQQPPQISAFLPLHAALECGASPAVLNYILQKGTNQLMERNRMGMLPLHLAAAYFKEESLPIILNVLWKHYEQASSVRDNLGRLPLHLALQARADCRLVECLLHSATASTSGSSTGNAKEDHDAPDTTTMSTTNNDNNNNNNNSSSTNSAMVDEYPLFMATEYGCDLSTIFLLLREDPTVLKNASPI
ncbi:unnamed protein product [Cylindrotheca closterium]|uniref:Uncharacterized protein n=1 Tax=Cylindrotheca closterium TaxID=2856 RepID=A0AAD2FWE5_9STRA|nr:unnamed protein product [Cylindrotheca closterium]